MIFVAGDWTDIEKRDLFDKAEAQLIDTQKHHKIYGTSDVINSAKVLETLPFLDYKQQVDLMLYLLSRCDIIYMLKGWETNNDVRLLHDYADNNGYKIIYSKKF